MRSNPSKWLPEQRRKAKEELVGKLRASLHLIEEEDPALALWRQGGDRGTNTRLLVALDMRVQATTEETAQEVLDEDS